MKQIIFNKWCIKNFKNFMPAPITIGGLTLLKTECLHRSLSVEFTSVNDCFQFYRIACPDRYRKGITQLLEFSYTH